MNGLSVEGRRFPYVRTSPELRTAILGLQIYSAFETLAVLALVFIFAPGPWRYGSSAALLAFYGYAFWLMRRALSTTHATSTEGLELRVGGRFHRVIPWEVVAGAGPACSAPPPLTLGLHLRLDAKACTLFLVTGRANLIELRLAEPVPARLGRSAGAVERIFFNVDEPAEFLAEVERHTAGRTTVERPARDAEEAVETPILPAPGEWIGTRAKESPPILFAAPSTWAPDFTLAAGFAQALRLEKVTRRYGGLVAVDRLSFSAARGEVFGFVGPNGAGKTTTIKMMTGLLLPSEGRIAVAGHDVWQSPVAAKAAFGYVPDTPVFYERLTVREFLAFLADLRRLPEREARSRIAEVLAFFELEGKAESPVHTLSLGNRRRLALAAAFLHRPPVLLLDEPTNGLDPRSARQVKDLLRQYRDRGGTIFLTTHLLELAEQLCDRLAVIHRGRLRALGSFAELQTLAGEGTSLEEVFLRLTEREAEPA